MKILVTGAAGFIGSNLLGRLASRGDEVVGLDNINDYYDVRLKYGRLSSNGFEGPFDDYGTTVSRFRSGCRFLKADICDKEFIDKVFEEERFDAVVHLAAQAGVRYSITNPYSYLRSNLEGFLNILEACRNNPVKHLVFASSSSVYGLNSKVPFSEEDKADSQVSLYGATKKADELMAHSYSKLYGIPALQSLSKKAIVNSLIKTRNIKDGTVYEDIDKGTVRIQFGIVDDHVRMILSLGVNVNSIALTHKFKHFL